MPRLRPSRDVDGDLVDTLDRLPGGFVVVPLPQAWFVAGAPGVFVVGLDGQGDDAVGRLAGRIRAVLAQHLTWVPFVHALLIAEQRRPVPLATVVPPDLLFDVLTEGRPSLEAETLGRIGEVAARGLLARAATEPSL